MVHPTWRYPDAIFEFDREEKPPTLFIFEVSEVNFNGVSLMKPIVNPEIKMLEYELFQTYNLFESGTIRKRRF